MIINNKPRERLVNCPRLSMIPNHTLKTNDRQVWQFWSLFKQYGLKIRVSCSPGIFQD